MTLVHEFRDTYFAVSWFRPDYFFWERLSPSPSFLQSMGLLFLVKGFGEFRNQSVLLCQKIPFYILFRKSQNVLDTGLELKIT